MIATQLSSAATLGVHRKIALHLALASQLLDPISEIAEQLIPVLQPRLRQTPSQPRQDPA
jgi:hypothetical protein